MPKQGARLRKHHIRDSIRVAKGKTAVAQLGPTSVQSSLANGHDWSVRETESYFPSHPEAPADPPTVPRFSDRNLHQASLNHARKRSNTGSRIPPPLSFRGFSGPAATVSAGHAPTNSIAGLSVGTNGSSDIYQSQPSSSIAGYTGMSASGRSSIRTSDASARPGMVVNNFFDAVGTVRMEAFISPMALSRFDDFPEEQEEIVDPVGMNRRRSRERRRRRSRNRDSYFGGGGNASGKGRGSDDWYAGGGNKTAGEEEYDPFRGF